MKAKILFSVGLMSLCIMLVISLVNAQAPQLLNYQGKLVKADGKAEDGTFTMTFAIYSTETGGTALWSETQNNITVAKGIFSVLLGSVTAFPNTLFTGSGARYLGIKVGTEAEMAPRFRLTSVPYAQRAGEADAVKDGSITNSKIANGAITQEKLASNISDNDWTISGGNIYRAAGNVGIGISNPIGKLHVSHDNLYAGYFTSNYLNSNTHIIHAEYNGSAGTQNPIAVYGSSVPQDDFGGGGYFIGGDYGVRGEVLPTGSGVYYSVYGYVYGGSGANYAVRGYSYGTGTNFAIRGSASGATGSTGSNYGVYATAGGTGTNYGIYSSGANYAIYANGDIAYTANLTHVSDEKFKQNIQPLTQVISKIMRLECKQFEFTTNPDYHHLNLASGKQYGLIAQELEKVFPELVVDVIHPPADEDDGKRGEPIHYKGINYVELIPILLQAIKEQQQSIDSLKIEISRLK